MDKIKMTRQEWETILNETQEKLTDYVDYLVNGEGLNANGIVSELQNSRMYYESDNIELSDGNE